MYSLPSKNKLNEIIDRISRYKKVIASKNYVEACQEVRKAGYATSLSYSQSLINLIKSYGLDQWDPK